MDRPATGPPGYPAVPMACASCGRADPPRADAHGGKGGAHGSGAVTSVTDSGPLSSTASPFSNHFPTGL